jgi:hypothetical protein
LLPARRYWNIKASKSKYPASKALAIQVFGMVASSAASERGFSTMNFIHSKLRNCLSPEKVQKLIYIKISAPKVLGTPSADPRYWDFSDMSEEEDEVGNNGEEDDNDDEDDGNKKQDSNNEEDSDSNQEPQEC